MDEIKPKGSDFRARYSLKRSNAYLLLASILMELEDDYRTRLVLYETWKSGEFTYESRLALRLSRWYTSTRKLEESSS